MRRSKEEILEELASVSEDLRRADHLSKQRDQLVLEATRADASRSEVGKAAGVSRGRVQQIVTEERKAKKRTQTGLAVLAVIAVGVGLLAVVKDDAPEMPSPAEAAPLSVAEIRGSDANAQVRWLASVVTRNERRSMDAQSLRRFVCDGISRRQAQEASTLLAQPITAESLATLNAACPENS